MPSQGPVRYEFSLKLPTEFIQVVFFIIRTFPCGLNPLFRKCVAVGWDEVVSL